MEGQDTTYTPRTILYRCPICYSEPLELTSVGQSCIECDFEHELDDDILKLLEEQKYFTPKRSSWRE